MRLLRTIALAAGWAMAGCATMKGGATQLVRVTSTPPGAEVSSRRAVQGHDADVDPRDRDGPRCPPHIVRALAPW